MFLFFVEGGLLFMSILTLLLIAVLFFAFRSMKDSDNIKHLKSAGLLALIVGILGQLIGLFSAFSSMEAMQGTISPNILAGGFKISLITTIYGLIIFGISQVIAFVLNMKK